MIKYINGMERGKFFNTKFKCNITVNCYIRKPFCDILLKCNTPVDLTKLQSVIRLQWATPSKGRDNMKYYVDRFIILLFNIYKLTL